MTVSLYTQEWKEWCAGADPEGWLCDALRFIFYTGETISLANKIPIQPTMILTHEGGANVEYTFCGFAVSMPQKTLTTEYKLEITMRPVANALLARIANATSLELNQIIRVEYRLYLLPSNANAPAATPAGKYYVSAIATSRGAITVTCLPPNLSKKRAGTAYRLEEFAGLARF
jgi:hypothetical protein